MGLSPWQHQAAILAAFRTAWGGSSLQTPVAWPNLPFDPAAAFPSPADSDAWVRPVYQQPEEGDSRIGESGYLFRIGRFTVEIYVRSGKGTSRAYDLADDVLVFLRGQTVAETHFSGLGVNEIGDDGTWWQVNVGAAFRYVSDTAPP